MVRGTKVRGHGGGVVKMAMKGKMQASLVEVLVLDVKSQLT